MANCKVLGLEDSAIVPAFVEIMQSRFQDLAKLDHEDSIAEAAKQYTEKYVLENLHPKGEKRFVGHFGQFLDGVLVEKSEQIPGAGFVVNQATLNWVMAKISGKGIGSELIWDSIERAKQRREDVVTLSVFARNTQAKALYERIGFELNMTYDEGRRLLMCYYLNPKIRP